MSETQFSKLEIERYRRHMVLRKVGADGQKKLKAAKVLLIGAGGLGSPMALYLAASGVGTIGIVDDDHVSLSNLQRQILHKTQNVGELKTESAVKTLEEINPHVNVIPINKRITADNALELIKDYDIVADGSDNFTTRYLMNDACYLAKKPLVFAAIGPFDGQLTTFRAFEKNEEGKPNPNYRCIFPNIPPEGSVPTCSDVGILGAVAGVMGTMQAVEVLKEILGIGESLVGTLVLYDALSCQFQHVKISWDPANPLNGEPPTLKDLSHFKDIKSQPSCDAS